MKITLEAKPFEILVEIPGYGVFKVHRIGAGTEADLARSARELSEAQEEFAAKYQAVIDKETKLQESGDNKALNELKASADYTAAEAAQKAISKQLQCLNDRMREITLSLWTSDDQKALDRLVSELSLEQLRSLYAQAMAQADGEKGIEA